MHTKFTKLFAVIVTTVMLVVNMCFNYQDSISQWTASAATTILGDINGDGRINAKDLTIYKRALLNNTALSLDVADLNADGVADIKDVYELQDYLLCRVSDFTSSLKKSISSLDRSIAKESISSKELGDYVDIQVTGDMASLAKSLKTPEEIYKYIANNVNTDFYNGLRKGSIGTFEQNCGNDYDQASLLLAMLNYMDYDASYAAVNASVTADDLIAMTYTDNISSAITIYTSQGKSLSKQTNGTYTIDRVGVVLNYNDSNYFLDPAFKKYEKNPDATDLVSLSNEIDQKYFNTEQDDYYTAAMELQSAYSDQTIADAFPQYRIIPQGFGMPSYTILSDSETAFSYRDTIDIYIGSNKCISYPSAFLYNHNLTIEYEFAEYADEEIQEFYTMLLDSLGLDSVDDLTKDLGTYEKQVYLNAVVKLDGQKVAVGASGNLGDKEQLQIKVTSNGQEAVFDKELTYGALYSVVFDYQIISPYEIADLYSKLPQTVTEQNKLNSNNIYGSETMMNTLSLIGKTYYSQVDTNNSVLANSSNSYNSRNFSVAVVDYTPEIRTDTYVRLTGNGKIGIDVIGNRPLFYSRSGISDDESKLRHSAGYLSSYLESAVLEQMTGIRSVSTAEVFSQAAEQGIAIIHISKDNLNELGNCKISDTNKADITEYANQGMIITVPQEEVTMNKWSGTGYIVYDPQTGTSTYIINNNLNGGSLCSWVTLSFICDLAIFFVECTWAFNAIMMGLALFCAVPFLAGGAALIVGLLGLTSFVIGAKFTISIGENLRDDTLLYMQYLDGDIVAGEQLKFSALGHAVFVGAAIGLAKLVGGGFSKALASKRFGPALQNLGNSIGGYFSDAFAGTPGGFEGAIRLINRVSPSSGKLISSFIGTFGSGFAKSLGCAYYNGGIEGVDSFLRLVEKYGETANQDFLLAALKGTNWSDTFETYDYLDQIAEKYSEETMHYEFGAGDYTPKDEDALELSEILKREGQAKTMYAKFRASTDDVASIAHNTGWTTEDIATVKNHLFLDSVLKDEGYGLLDPTYEIAVAWERLIAGNYYECDILLLRHELFEATYYNYFHSINGCTLRDAHNLTSLFYDWATFIKALAKGG